MFLRSLKLSNSNSFFLFGARGTGKTTLIQNQLPPTKALTLDLLDNNLFAQLQTSPHLLESVISNSNQEWVIIDEVQKIPALLDEVHRLIENRGQKFALTGSSARKLKRGKANLLAGRAFVFKLFPLTYSEINESFQLNDILTYGSLPKIFTFNDTREKILFLRAYADTYLKEEILIEQLIRNLPPFRRFLQIAAFQDTELVSYSNIARDVGVDPKIISNYYDILEDTLLGFRLEPFHYSIRKRQKKSPKFYWFDLGVRRILAGTIDQPVIEQSYEYGSLFESFIVNECYRGLLYQEKSHSLSYLRVDDKKEADLILERNGIPTYVIEIKSTNRIHENHVRSVKQIAGEIKKSIPLVLSNDPLSKTIEGVSCLHWKKGLKELGL